MFNEYTQKSDCCNLVFEKSELFFCGNWTKSGSVLIVNLWLILFQYLYDAWLLNLSSIVTADSTSPDSSFCDPENRLSVPGVSWMNNGNMEKHINASFLHLAYTGYGHSPRGWLSTISKSEEYTKGVTLHGVIKVIKYRGGKTAEKCKYDLQHISVFTVCV